MAKFIVHALCTLNNNRKTEITTYNNTNKTTLKHQTIQNEANRMMWCDTTKICRVYFGGLPTYNLRLPFTFAPQLAKVWQHCLNTDGCDSGTNLSATLHFKNITLFVLFLL
jgi:hypothetical protein